LSLTDFRERLWKSEHPSYDGSALSPVAPEYSTGEVLLGAAYRRLLLGVQEATVDPEGINTLPTQLEPTGLWDELLLGEGGLASPALAGQRGTAILRQLMPLVPEVARHACVLGRPRSRWDPARLLFSTIASGNGEESAREILHRVRLALSVSDDDDLFARFVETSLAALASSRPDTPPDPGFGAPAYRPQKGAGLSPAERFCGDLGAILELKPRLTRRQWVVLLEALLRLGLSMHMLWLCRLNEIVWHAAISAAKGSAVAGPAEIERVAWEGHRFTDPLLELGRDGIAAMRRRIEGYAIARIGLNVVLHALEDARCPWPGGPLGKPGSGGWTVPESLAGFLSHVAAHASSAQAAVASAGYPSLLDACRAIADAHLSLLACKSGPTKNLFEFMRHSLGQLQPRFEEQRSYDQAYLLIRKTRATSSPWPVQPGPATLIMLVHACCQSLGGLPVSVEDFRSHLADYGILAPAGELQGGQCSRNLERLGLVVDSPDAGGGRLLVDPFQGGS